LKRRIKKLQSEDFGIREQVKYLKNETKKRAGVTAEKRGNRIDSSEGGS